MYTTIIHPLRKAYCLSINEYCVLEAIRGLANNIKYNGWCLMSIVRIAHALDLSDRTVSRAYQKLEKVGLIERRKESLTDTAVRSVDEWNEWFMADKADMLLSLKTGEVQLTTISERSKEYVTTGDKLSGVVTNCQGGGDKLSYNTNIDTNKLSNIKEKEKRKSSLLSQKIAERKKLCSPRGEAGVVLLTDLEARKISQQYGRSNLNRYIKALENWKMSKGKENKSDYHTILNWISRDLKAKKLVITSFDFDEADFDTKAEYDEKINRY